MAYKAGDILNLKYEISKLNNKICEFDFYSFMKKCVKRKENKLNKILYFSLKQKYRESKEQYFKHCYACRDVRGDIDDHKCVDCPLNIFHKTFYFSDTKETINNTNYVGD